MKQDFRLVVATLPDRDREVVEIWIVASHFAELSFESNSAKIEIYTPPQGKFWNLEFLELLKVLDSAKLRLADVLGVDADQL